MTDTPYKPKIELPIIYYDHREVIADNENTQKKKALIEAYGFSQCNNMMVGDYQCGDIVFELKEPKDLVESILDKRIFEQIRKMVDFGFTGRLIVHGTEEQVVSYATNKRKMHPNAIKGFFASLIEINMPPIFIQSWEDIFEIMVRTFAKHHDGVDRIHTTHQNNVVYKDQKMNIVTGFGYIGETKARKILEYFNGDLNAFFNADIDTLKKIPTIGKKTAIKIYELTHQGNPEIVENEDTEQEKKKTEKVEEMKAKKSDVFVDFTDEEEDVVVKSSTKNPDEVKEKLLEKVSSKKVVEEKVEEKKEPQVFDFT